MTRPDYYTVPALEELINYKQQDDSCVIKGFTIGRIGYGNVSFPDAVDISNLNLDELVHFRYRELSIYLDDTKKPPLNQELNRRAQITLDRVYPKSRNDQKLITNVEDLIALDFGNTLRELCRKHGTKFVDYRAETGSWVFLVDHFSKYGITVENDVDLTISNAVNRNDLDGEITQNNIQIIENVLDVEMEVDSEIDVDKGVEQSNQNTDTFFEKSDNVLKVISYVML